MPRKKPDDPKIRTVSLRLTEENAHSLRKCSEALRLGITGTLLRGLALLEAEIAKGQAPVEK